jgi:predicted metal-dependent enzyme (double-stranded beta helix superfamily)
MDRGKETRQMSGTIDRLRDFVVDFTGLIGGTLADSALLQEGRDLLAGLIARDSWLPDAYAAPHAEHYQQYLLHCDPLERFSVVSFVWGPGQRTPVHDHRVWGLVGVLRGAEYETRYVQAEDGSLAAASSDLLQPGDVSVLSPSEGDIHRVANALDDRVSVSIHVYGDNISRRLRSTYDPATGAEQPFQSGYSAATLPNLWNRAIRPQ